ncbi:MAG TPA: MerR family transcriptional regulator [Puia sp.]|jgi:DNA-binding transcriptional MerR regulator
MKNEFSQMAFDFPMQAEPQAPPKNGLSAHHGELNKVLGLSAEEANTVHEEGRRAGVVVRIKSLKRASEQTTALVADPPPKASEKLFIQASIPLGDIELPIVNAEIEVALLSPSIAESAVVEPAVVDSAIAESAAVVESSVAANPIEAPASPEAAAPPLEPPLPRRTRSAARPAPVEKVKSKRGRKSLKEVAAEAELIDIPADEVLFSKQYYTMGEVAEMFHVNQSLLRFWETEFSILQPRKNRKGDRYFRPIDIKNLHLIYHLLRQRKYTIEGAKEFLRTNKKAEQRFEAIQKLQQIKAFLLELKAQL